MLLRLSQLCNYGSATGLQLAKTSRLSVQSRAVCAKRIFEQSKAKMKSNRMKAWNEFSVESSRPCRRQENPLMYIDVYFRILHADTIIYSIYLNIGFPITCQEGSS